MNSNTFFGRDSQGKIILREDEIDLISNSNISAKEIIEKRLGYEFKLEEIPPNLRAREKSLEQQWQELTGEAHHYWSEEEKEKMLPQQKEEEERRIEEEKRRIEEEYDQELHSLNEEVNNQGCLAVLLLFLFILPAVLYLIIIGKRRGRIREERSQALTALNEEYPALDEKYPKLEKEIEAALRAGKEKIIPLIKDFNNELIPLSNDIDTSINALFRAKMDFGLLRSTMKTKGLVIEKIECPYCGGVISLPETGYVTKCEHCGRDVYAVNIFKELEKR